MKEYEILVETINPCGGEAHAKKEILEAECESPESYVQANAPLPGHGPGADQNRRFADHHRRRQGEHGPLHVHGVLSRYLRIG